MRTRLRPPSRGSSLIEVMIAMAILAVGLLAMWNLHVVGITSTAAGRRQTVAAGLARELLSGLERLPFGDARLSDTITGKPVGTPPVSPPPGPFGNLVTGSGAITSGYHPWDDAAPIGGVRLSTELPEATAGVSYDRRWTVWGLVSPTAPAGAAAGVKVIAVSVVWRDPPFTRPREVVLYTQIANPAAIVTGLGSNP